MRPLTSGFTPVTWERVTRAPSQIDRRSEFIDKIRDTIGFYCYQGSHGETMEHKCLDPHVMIMMHFLKFKGDWDLHLFCFVFFG